MAEQPKKPTIIELDRLRLFADHPDIPNVRSQLAWCFREGYPRLTVYTNDPNLQGMDRIIYAPFDPINVQSFLSVFEDIARSNVKKEYVINCYNAEWKDGKAIPNSKVLQSAVTIGKDEEGVVWLMVIADKKPRIRFNVLVDEWHTIYRDGVQFTKAEVSKLQALSLVTILRKCYNELISIYSLPMNVRSNIGRLSALSPLIENEPSIEIKRQVTTQLPTITDSYEQDVLF